MFYKLEDLILKSGFVVFFEKIEIFGCQCLHVSTSTFMQCFFCVYGITTLKFCFSIFLKGKDKESEIFSLLVHFPNVCSSQIRAGSMPKAKNSILMLHIVAGTHILEASVAYQGTHN